MGRAGCCIGGEIGERIREMMGSELLRRKAAGVKEEARKAVGDGGSCGINLMRLFQEWKTSKGSI
jgi:hypothetical protein